MPNLVETFILGHFLTATVEYRLMREPELQEFVNLKTGKEKIAYQVSDGLRLAVDRRVWCIRVYQQATHSLDPDSISATTV